MIKGSILSFASEAKPVKSLFCLCLFFMLGACSSGNDDTTAVACVPDEELAAGSTNVMAFVAGRAADYSSGQTRRISITGCDVVDGNYPATGSDIRVVTDGDSIYELGRFLLDSVTKYDSADTALPVYQYSVAGDESSANPYELVFVSDTKAYLIRYDSPIVWIVDPSAQSAGAFKVGEIDLGAYDTADGIPEASGAVLVGEKLFVSMERLDRVFAPPNYTVDRVGYIAVIDTVTDTEIDTGMGEADGLNGIPLGVRNPASLQFSSDSGLIYLVGLGDNFSAPSAEKDRYTGGVESIDPETYSRELVLDDGTEETNQGFMNELLVVSGGQAYVVTSASFANNTLRSLNPITGELADEPVAGLAAKDITTVAVDPNNRLWVGLGGDTPGFQLLNAANGVDLNAFIATSLIPINVVYIETQIP